MKKYPSKYFRLISMRLKRKYILSLIMACICQYVVFIWMDSYYSFGQKALEDLTKIQSLITVYMSGQNMSNIHKFLASLNYGPVFLLNILICLILGLSLTIMIKYYIHKEDENILEAVKFTIIHFPKILLLKSIEVIMVIIGLVICVLPGLYLYAKLVIADYILIDHPERGISSILQTSFKYSEDIVKKIYLNIPLYLLFIGLSYLRLLLLHRNLLDTSFFNSYNMGLTGLYFIVLPILYAYYEEYIIKQS